MQEIVKDAIENDIRTVRVDGHYGSLVISELYLKIKQNVELIRLSSDEEPSSFRISRDEMDDITAAWLKFKQDQQNYREAEEAEQKAMEKKALDLAAQHPEIKVKAQGSSWEVSIPSYGWAMVNPSYCASDLMSQVKLALETLEERNKWIFKTVDGILSEFDEIDYYKTNDGYWNLCIEVLHWNDVHVFTPLELLNKCQEARKEILVYRRSQKTSK